ncbi:MAG: hypothetical protein AAGI06_09270 [Pseudomonadota bacterium]
MAGAAFCFGLIETHGFANFHTLLAFWFEQFEHLFIPFQVPTTYSKQSKPSLIQIKAEEQEAS